MQITTIITGQLQENAYLIYNEDNRDAILIDPGDDAAKIIRVLGKKDLSLSHIILTHGHFDHIGAVSELYEKYKPLIAIHKDDASMLVDSERHTIPFIKVNLCKKNADIFLEDGETFFAGGQDFKVMHTPGHTPGSICLITKNIIFTGDTLFAGSIGRTDFKEGNAKDMEKSLKKIKNLSGNYKIYPGHGDSTDLEFERLNNPFLSTLK